MNAISHNFQSEPVITDNILDAMAQNLLPDERPRYVVDLLLGMFESGVISNRIRANSWLKPRAPDDVRQKLIGHLYA